MPEPAPAAFRELVLSRSASLQRTARLLARDEQDAGELLQEALARASRSWGRSGGQPEAYCRSLLARVASSAGRRRRHTGGDPKVDPAPADSPASPAAALRALPPRQRAVIVLRHYHHYTPEQTAEALDIATSTVAAQEEAALAALGHRNLTGTLNAIADATHAPDATALLAGAQRRAQQIGRRRRTAWVAAVAVVVGVAGAGALLNDSRTEDLNGVDLAVPDAGYTDGYGILGGVPQPYTIDGLRLITSHEVPPGGQWSTGVSPSEPGTALYAVAWCSPEEDSAGPDPSPVTLSSDGQTVLSLTCTPPTDQRSVAAEPLPFDASLWQVDNLMSRQSAVVAVYEEVAWADFPFEPTGHRMEWSPPSPSAGSVVMDAMSPVASHPELEAAAGTTSTYSVTVPMTTTTRADLDVILDGPGQLLVALDGVVVSDDGDLLAPSLGPSRGSWPGAETDLRDGFVHSFDAGVRRRTLSVDSDSLADLGVDLRDGQVVVSVVPRAVRPKDWAVEIRTRDFTPAARTVLDPVPDDTLPTYAFGLRQIGTVEVPADGRPRQVDVDPKGGGPLVWVPECPSEPAVEGLLVMTLGVTEHRVSCTLGDPWFGAVRSSSDEADQPPPGRPTITVDPTLARDSVRVTAYEPLAWTDYPFESSTSAPVLQGLPEPGQATSSGNDGLTNVYVQTDVVTQADLNDDGQAVLRLEPAQVTDLVVRTTGVGRFRLEVASSEPVAVGLPDLAELPYGQVLERDGWWSSWTAGPSTWRVPALSRADGRSVLELGEEITVTAEGYQDGALEIAAISLLPADDD